MAERPLQLFTHPASGFCRRVTYALSFKGVAYETIETDLMHPSADFLSVSHTGKIPAARVWKQGKPHGLVESLCLLEYVDLEYHGPPLYPRCMDGTVDWLQKALLDAAIKKEVEALYLILSGIITSPDSAKTMQALQHSLQVLNDHYLADGRNFGHTIIDSDMVSAGDIALLPFIELVDACRDTLYHGIQLENYANVWKWYKRLSEQPWVTRNYPGHTHLNNAVKSILSGQYPQLTLPVTLYD